MRGVAWTLSIVGGLCAVMGIILAVEVVSRTLVAGLNWTFWFQIAAILILASISFALLGRGEE